MRYLIAVMLLAAFMMQISCKNNEPQSKTETAAVSREVPAAKEAVAEEFASPEPVQIAQAVDVKPAAEVVKTENTPDKPKEQVKEQKDPAPPVPEKKPAAASIDEKGIVSYVEGTVRKKTLDEDDFRTNVAQKAPVKSRESYRTMVRSRAELELSEMDILRLAPRTTVDLVALYEETRDGGQKTDVNLAEGDLWAQINSSGENSEFMMNTDIAAAAITGTNFRMSKNGDLTEMKVYHGEVRISNAKDKMDSLEPSKVTDFKAPGQTLGPRQVSGPKQVTLEEWVYIVKNMQKISFDRNGKVVSAGEFKANDPDERSDWVEWNKRMDRERGLK